MRILVPMVADLFHWGHVNFLERIKNKYPNSTIIIGLHTDESVQKYKRKPILTFTERYKILKSCKYIDEIIKFDCEMTIDKNFLKKYDADLLVHAHPKEEHEKYKQLWENIPNNFERFDYSQGISTTDIINRIKILI